MLQRQPTTPPKGPRHTGWTCWRGILAAAVNASDTLHNLHDDVNFLQTPGNRSGFTLVEMMIVVAIIGILSALAVSSGRKQAELQALDNARLGVDRVFREARAQAHSTGRAYAIKRFADRVEVFTWNDADNDLAVDWSDGNGNGQFDNGEGEVVGAFLTAILRQRPGLMAPARDVAALTTTPLCGTAPTAGDPDVALFLPNSGRLVDVELSMCRAVVDIFDVPQPTRTARIQSTPSGVVRSGLFGGL